MHLNSANSASNHIDPLIDLCQQPADLIILSAQEAELSLLSKCHNKYSQELPSLRLASLLDLKNPASLDLYYQNTMRHARLIVAVFLGGQSYWPHLLEILKLHQNKNAFVVIVNGEDAFDPYLSQQSELPLEQQKIVHTYLREGGWNNYTQLLFYLSYHFFSGNILPKNAEKMPKVQVLVSQLERSKNTKKPIVPILFYKSYLQTDTHGFIEDWPQNKVCTLGIAVDSLKSIETQKTLRTLFRSLKVTFVINTTGFCTHNAWLKIPMAQAFINHQNLNAWRKNPIGLRNTDLTMQITLPEIDGRIITSACVFKTKEKTNSSTQIQTTNYKLHRFHAKKINQLAYQYTHLKRLSNARKRVAILLNNYPNSDAKIGNAVGLDTPKSLFNVLKKLHEEGFNTFLPTSDSNELFQLLIQGVTNHASLHSLKKKRSCLFEADYQRFFKTLPKPIQRTVHEKWGFVEQDPYNIEGVIEISGLCLGNVFIGIQPSRGHHFDTQARYHSPTLPPTHHYLAFYHWVNTQFKANAIIHFGKHGNLEWLPGKSCALSWSCFPQLICPNILHLYPFIVNDPGEGIQAKRRTHAVVIDHLMPPLSMAGTYKTLELLENLIDEYRQALHVDLKRTQYLEKNILKTAQSMKLNKELKELNIESIDDYLCEIKSSTIRSGLHILGEAATAQKQAKTLLCLSVVQRGNNAKEWGLLEALSMDYFKSNIMKIAATKPWKLHLPDSLNAYSKGKWKTHKNAHDAIRAYALALLNNLLQNNTLPALAQHPHSYYVFKSIANELLPKLQQSREQEMQAILDGLNAKHIEPGSSGAPSRGRWDVLPTGRNFYGIDHQYIPTPSAYELGKNSARLLVETYIQEHGEYPQSIGLSVWATSTMRTGGDDIAQAAALMGIRPTWSIQNARVTGFEIIPIEQLKHPRINVVLRISGMFRDAFMHVVEQLDLVIEELAQRNEKNNYIFEQAQCIQKHLTETHGLKKKQAEQQSCLRIFGSKLGGYGVGIQSVLDAKNWTQPEQLARTYIEWSQYTYSAKHLGTSMPQLLRTQLKNINLVMHNQDNKEHDILDSDDYYQFQGGMIAAAKHTGNTTVKSYFADHSQPNQPKIHTLEHEINRVMRARVLNPTWLNGMKEHGYKGAFEMLATLDYLFGYSATSGLVQPHHYENLWKEWIKNKENQQFIKQNNPDALTDMLERFSEAIERGLWKTNQAQKKDVMDELKQHTQGIEE